MTEEQKTPTFMKRAYETLFAASGFLVLSVFFGFVNNTLSAVFDVGAVIFVVVSGVYWGLSVKRKKAKA